MHNPFSPLSYTQVCLPIIYETDESVQQHWKSNYNELPTYFTNFQRNEQYELSLWWWIGFGWKGKGKKIGYFKLQSLCSGIPIAHRSSYYAGESERAYLNQIYWLWGWVGLGGLLHGGREENQISEHVSTSLASLLDLSL